MSRAGKILTLIEVKPTGVAQTLIMNHVNNMMTNGKTGIVELSSLARHPDFRGIHFKKIMTAASALSKKKMIQYDGTSNITIGESGELGPQYSSVNDAAQYEAGLAKGPVKIWYTKADVQRDLISGPEFWTTVLKKALPTSSTVKQTHTLLGSVKEKNLERIFHHMQGEIWSPRGEARTLIRGLKLRHTSMSVGDIVQIGSNLFMVDRLGFLDLQTGKETK